MTATPWIVAGLTAAIAAAQPAPAQDASGTDGDGAAPAPATATATAAAAPQSGGAPLKVQIVTVTQAPVAMDFVLTGAIEARDSLDVGFRLGGRVTEVLVSAGDTVKQGEPLARTDAVQQEQALGVAQASLDSAVAVRDQAALAADRAVALLERGVGTSAARDAAAEQLSSAEGGVAQATSALEQARRAVDDTVLRAPQDVVVTDRVAEPGQIVGPAQTVLSLAVLSGLDAVFQTPNSPLLDDAVGSRVSLVPLDLPDREMTGVVSDVDPLVNAATGSVEVTVRIDDAVTDTALLGASVRGKIAVPDGSGMQVPWTALTANAGEPAVWVVGDDGRVAIAPVVIERFQDGIVLIDSGLTPGQRVVGAGSQMLFPGRPVATSDAIPNEPARPEHADDGAGTTGATTAAPPATAQPKATP